MRDSPASETENNTGRFTLRTDIVFNWVWDGSKTFPEIKETGVASNSGMTNLAYYMQYEIVLKYMYLPHPHPG